MAEAVKIVDVRPRRMLTAPYCTAHRQPNLRRCTIVVGLGFACKSARSRATPNRRLRNCPARAKGIMAGRGAG